MELFFYQLVSLSLSGQRSAEEREIDRVLAKYISYHHPFFCLLPAGTCIIADKKIPYPSRESSAR